MKRRTILTLALVAIILLTAISASAAWAFQDVKEDAWYAEGVDYVLEKEYMKGINRIQFAPDEPITRGMLVTVLYRIAGSPSVSEDSAFTDVKKGSYYADAVSWAAASGIVNGYSATSFGPDDDLTREQLAAILYRYSALNGYDVSAAAELSSFSDASRISNYAKTAMQWANAVGLITGTGEHTLSPQGTATRAQLATIIMRFEKAILSSQEEPETETGAHSEGTTHTEDHDEPVDTGKPTITVSSVTANAGDSTVQVVVSVKNNPGILGMSLTLTYDESKMTLEAAANGSALNSYLTMTKSKTLSSGCNFIWDGVDVSSEDIADGEILVLTFKIKDTAANGTYPLSIVSDGGYIVDNSLSKVPVTVVNGSIIVK